MCRKLLGISIALLIALPAVAAERKCELQRYAELPVTMSGTRPIVSGTINGKPARFLADSGAFFSTISREAAEKYQLKVGPSPVQIRGVGGSVNTGLGKAKEFSLAGFYRGQTINNVDFFVVGTAFGGDVAGVIGQNVLGHADVEYDLANGFIRLFNAKNCSGRTLAYWGGNANVAEMRIGEVTPLEPHMIGNAILNGKKIRILFDSGAWRSLLKVDAAERAGITPEDEDVKALGISRGVGKRTTENWLARFDSLDLGGEVIKNARLRIGDFSINDADMLLGADFFLSHRIYFASKQSRMYFTYNGGPVFDLRTTFAERKPLQPTEAEPVVAATTAAVAGSPAEPPVASAAGEPATIPATEAPRPTGAGPSDSAGFRRRGAAAAGRQDFQSAVADFDQAIKLDPNDPENYYQRGLVRHQNRQPQLAIADFDQTLKLKPDHVQALMSRGALRLARGNQPGARADFDVAEGHSPNDISMRFEIATLYEGTGNYDEAIRRFDAWIAANPKDDRIPEALNDRCRARAMANKELDKALSDCNIALKNGSRSSAQYETRAFVYLRMGDYDKSIADYKASLKLQPKNGRPLYGLGLAELKKGLKAEGNRDIQAAIEINPGVADGYKRIGLTP